MSDHEHEWVWLHSEKRQCYDCGVTAIIDRAIEAAEEVETLRAQNADLARQLEEAREDNAALLEDIAFALTAVDFDKKRRLPDATAARLGALFDKPHPGDALRSEMQAMRDRLAAAERALGKIAQGEDCCLGQVGDTGHDDDCAVATAREALATAPKGEG